MGILQETSTTLNSGSASSVSLQFANDCTPGSVIEVWTVNDGGLTPTSVSDGVNSGNYTAGAKVTDSASGEWSQFLYYYQNQQSATKLTITVEYASAITYTGILMREIGGVTAAPYQTSVMAQQLEPGTGAGAIASPGITPSANPCLLSAFCLDFAATANTNAANGTLGIQGLAIGSLGYGTTETQILESDAEVTATFTNATDGGSNYFITGAALWTLASGNPPIARIYANQAMWCAQFQEGLAPSRIYANSNIQANLFVEVAAGQTKVYANGTIQSTQFIE